MKRGKPYKHTILTQSDYVYEQDIKDRFNVLEKYGLSVIINLCGGILPGVEKLQLHGFSITPSVININVTTNLYTVSRLIDFEYGEIDNNNMEVVKKNTHIGTTLFLNQLREARKQGITQLNTIADFGYFHGDKDGYYRWGRVGYQMSVFDQQEFTELMNRFNRLEKDLGTLLLTEEGYAFWKREGFTWQGRFFTQDGTPAMDYLQGYLKRKRIDFDF